jgi:hypothetical protein
LDPLFLLPLGRVMSRSISNHSGCIRREDGTYYAMLDCDASNTWFDRTPCPDPCGAMHTRSQCCGKPLGPCAHDPSEDEQPETLPVAEEGYSFWRETFGQIPPTDDELYDAVVFPVLGEHTSVSRHTAAYDTIRRFVHKRETLMAREMLYLSAPIDTDDFIGTAWTDIVNERGEDEWLTLCDKALREVQAETLRRAVKKIRAYAANHITPELYDVIRELTGLIDPDLDDDGVDE